MLRTDAAEQEGGGMEGDGMVMEQSSSVGAPVRTEEGDACLRWVVAFMVDLRLLTPEQALSDCGLSKHAYATELLDVQERFERDIYGHCWHRLVRYASSPARTFRLYDEVEDLAYEACQEATIKFLRRLSKLWPAIHFPTFAHIRAYFFVIARHCLVDVLRERKRMATAEPPRSAAETLKSSLAEQVPGLRKWSPKVLRGHVVKWLDALDEHGDRRLIEGRYFASPPESYKEIAAALNNDLSADVTLFTVGQLRVRKHRLTRDLLRYLTEACEANEV